MKPPSPTLEGFRAVLRQPSLGLAEVAWRWSFGGATALLAAISFLEYLDTLTVSRSDVLLLRTRQPALISAAIQHAVRGSGLRLVAAIIVLSFALLIGWIVIAALARAATIEALLEYVRQQFHASGFHVEEEPSWGWRLGSLLGLNFFRAGTTLAATVGCVAAVMVGGVASPADNPVPGLAVLITLAVALLVWLVWSTINWFLSLAPIFVVRDGRDMFASIAATIDLCRDHAGAVFAVGTWFGLAHLAAFFAAITVVVFPLGLSGLLPRGVILGGVLLVMLLYFAIVDFLYVGRLAAFVAMVESPGPTAPESLNPLPPDRGEPAAFSIRQTSAVDQDELILSDLPAPG